jgi:hypothetical protein
MENVNFRNYKYIALLPQTLEGIVDISVVTREMPNISHANI